MPRWRLETKAGISTKGETFDDPEVVNVCHLVLKAVGLVGPANVQGFVAEDGARRSCTRSTRGSPAACR